VHRQGEYREAGDGSEGEDQLHPVTVPSLSAKALGVMLQVLFVFS
jgi:hypothetical protein